jgi:endo-1,3(4)-beta-glucanase
MLHRRLIFLALGTTVVLTAILLASLASWPSHFSPSAGPRAKAIKIPPSTDLTTLGELPEDLFPQGRPVPPGLAGPLPTNYWWSSGLTAAFPSPLYAWPLMAHLTADGLQVSAPGRTVSARAVLAVPKDPLRLFPLGTPLTEARPQEWGDWHVKFAAHTSQGAEFSLTMAEGSPFAFVDSEVTDLAFQLPPRAQTAVIECGEHCGAALLVSTPETTYLLTVGHGGDIVLKSKSSGLLKLRSSDRRLSVAAVAPHSDPARYLPYALTPLTGTHADFSLTPDSVSTTFTFSQPTLYGVFPHQAPYLAAVPARTVGVYETLRGTVHLYEGASFTTVLPRPALLPSLPLLDELRSSAAFKHQLSQDVQALTPPAGDVYSAGKGLLKTAQLAQLAHWAGEGESAQVATAVLRTSLIDWCTSSPEETSNYFAYDAVRGGLLAVPPAFGSEHYNDHHFHTGYFLHAAAILAELKPDFAQNYSHCLDLLIRDIATLAPDDPSFPRLRSFDPYAGHSWANGLQPLADGNNQESTSEAIHAWFALARWGQATGDQELVELGTWLLTQELTAARVYWFNSLPSLNTLPSDFEPPLISILWGGKLDYSTFFDAAPTAIHGIQFFPLTTALLTTVNQDILSRLVTPLLSSSYSTIWQTQLSAVASLGPARAPSRPLPEQALLDASLSRSALLHWQGTLATLGTLANATSSCANVFTQDDGSHTAVVYRYPSDPTTCSLQLNLPEAEPVVYELTDLPVGWNLVNVPSP